jgi:hypothetical protein
VCDANVTLRDSASGGHHEIINGEPVTLATTEQATVSFVCLNGLTLICAHSEEDELSAAYAFALIQYLPLLMIQKLSAFRAIRRKESGRSFVRGLTQSRPSTHSVVVEFCGTSTFMVTSA